MSFLKSPESFLWPIRKIARQTISGIILILYSVSCIANDINEVASKFDKILCEILNLNTVTAQKMIDNGYKGSSGRTDMYLEYLNNWNMVIEVVLKEDQSKYEKYLVSLNERLDLIDKNADKSLPSHYILLAEIYAQAGMTQIFYRDYLSGLFKIMKANNYARENLVKYPDCWLNNKLCGILNVSLDQLSPFLKKMAGMINLRGDPETGFKQLSRYLKSVEEYPGLKAEALLYNGFALRMAKKDEMAFSLFNEKIVEDEAPVLNLFLYSNIMYLTGRNEHARTMLSELTESRFEVPFPFKDYLYGKSNLCCLNKEADKYLKQFMANSKSKNYKREVCSRLADYYSIYSNSEQFSYYRKLIGTYSKATTDRDREADIESKRPYDPYPGLLKARYLVHGGYYNEAYEILLSINQGELTREAYRNEYSLLMAKVKFRTNQLNEALMFCEKTIDKGRDCDEHYAAEAALLAGDILAQKGSKEKAVSYYKLALEIKGQNDVYIENIEKSANNRLKNL